MKVVSKSPLKSKATPGRDIIIGLAITAVIGIGIFGWQRVSKADPATVFWNAQKALLTQSGISCRVVDTGTDSVSNQKTSLDLASKANVRAEIKLEEQGTVVTTEELDTKTDVYVKYTALSTTKKNANGSRPDFSKALNVWSKTAIADQSASMFAKTALGNCVVPLVKLSEAQVAPLLTELQKNKVFKTDFAKARTGTLDGQPVIIYDVSIAPQPYIEYMKRVGQAYGLKILSKVDASGYAKKPAERVTFYVSSKSSHLQQIKSVDKARDITFADYGVQPQVTVPKTTISAQELQQRLQTR